MYSSVITLANSIIGVSILAMPYCYKQCGVILATLMVLLSGTIVKVACHLLIKSAIMARRRNIENLAFHTHGPVGKLLVELGIIGYLIGTSIAFFVVMGDLGPPLIAKLAGIEETYNLRLIILTGLGLFVALPLSMLRNIESLQIICASSIMFYLTVVFRVVLEAAPVLSSGHWLEGVALWRPAGILQCFPIFSMALACQANIFEVYSCLPDPSPQKMNLVVKGAVNLCSGLYITIGFFGYLAFHAQDFGGNILTSFTPTTKFVDLLKLGFVISVAVSFPLVVFPCRTSIHSLIFRKTYQGIGSTELVTDYIPPARFNLITFGVIVLTLCIGIVVPDIELVLGIVGSTMGSGICVIFPAVAFLKLTSKNTTERLAAQGALIIGIITMILGTYVNLAEHTSAPVQAGVHIKSMEYQQRFEQPKPVYVPSQNGGVPPPLADPRVDEGENIIKTGEAVIDKIVDNQNNIQDKVENIDAQKKEELKVSESVKNIAKNIEDEPENKRQEPAVPEEPEVIKKSEVDDKKSDNVNSSKSEVNNKSTSSAKPTLEKNSDKEVDKEDAKNKKSTDKEKLDPEELLKEMKKYKQEQESVLQEQKKILSELKQHQLEDVAKKEQNQQQPAPALTNNSAAAGQLPPQSGGQLASGQLPGDPAPANQISGGQVVGANSPALQVQASYQGQQQQVVQSGQQAALGGQEQPVASPQQVQNQPGQPAQLQQQPILNQQIVGQQQPIQNQQFVPQQPVQNQQPVQQPFQNQQPVQNQQPFQQPFQNQQPIQQPVQNQMLPQQSIQNQQPIQQPVQNQQPIQPPVQNQQQVLGQQPVQIQQLPQQPIQNPQYQGQQMQPVLNQGYASSGSYNAQLQANNQQQIVQQPQLQNIQPQQQMNNNYNQMNVQQSNQQVQLQNVQPPSQQMLNNQPPPQQMLNNQPQPQQQLFNNQPLMAAYSVNGNHEAGAEVPNAHLKMKNQAEVLGQANLLQSPGLGGTFDNNVKSGRDFKRDDHDMDRDSALCENDPNCAAKFDRNPLEDSPLSQDLLRLQYIGGKRNLQEERSISVNGNNSVKDEYL